MNMFSNSYFFQSTLFRTKNSSEKSEKPWSLSRSEKCDTRATSELTGQHLVYFRYFSISLHLVLLAGLFQFRKVKNPCFQLDKKDLAPTSVSPSTARANGVAAARPQHSPSLSQVNQSFWLELFFADYLFLLCLLLGAVDIINHRMWRRTFWRHFKAD